MNQSTHLLESAPRVLLRLLPLRLVHSRVEVPVDSHLDLSALFSVVFGLGEELVPFHFRLFIVEIIQRHDHAAHEPLPGDVMVVHRQLKSSTLVMQMGKFKSFVPYWHQSVFDVARVLGREIVHHHFDEGVGAAACGEHVLLHHRQIARLDDADQQLVGALHSTICMKSEKTESKDMHPNQSELSE